MIERSATYIWKMGEYNIVPPDNIGLRFVGGSPVGIGSGTYGGWGPDQAPPFYVYGAEDVRVQGATDLAAYIGVAYHSYDFANAKLQKVTVIYPPAELVIFQGWSAYYRQTQWAEEMVPFGTNSDDIVAPFDTTATYTPGAILTVASVTGPDGNDYAVWTPTTDAGTYPAKVINVADVGGRTFLRILLGTFVISS